MSIALKPHIASDSKDYSSIKVVCFLKNKMMEVKRFFDNYCQMVDFLEIKPFAPNP